jgi:hypothetical protein
LKFFLNLLRTVSKLTVKRLIMDTDNRNQRVAEMDFAPVDALVAREQAARVAAQQRELEAMLEARLESEQAAASRLCQLVAT